MQAVIHAVGLAAGFYPGLLARKRLAAVPEDTVSLDHLFVLHGSAGVDPDHQYVPRIK